LNSQLTRIAVWCVIVVGAATGLSAQTSEPPDTEAGGQQLPAPFGIGVTLYSQTQDYNLASLDLDVPGANLEVAESLPVDNRTDTYHLKFDYWVQPYLNLFALAGRIETRTTVALGGVDLGLPFPLSDLVIDNDGWVYGGGVTLAVGYDDFFGTVTGYYTDADLEVTTSSVEAWVVAPKVGYVVGKASLWVGAMYQDAEERHAGTYAIPFVGEVPFSVELNEAEHWNYQAGAVAGLTQHWMLTLEAGFGDRDSAQLSLDYRF